MNALVNIQLEAQVIVEQLADRQISEMKQRYNEYQEWVQIASNPVMRDSYYNDNSSIDEYESIFKYIYMTKFKQYNHELKQSVLSTVYPTDRKAQRGMAYDKGLIFQVMELREQTRDNWDVSYREQFIAGNMIKLNRALAKHLTDEMTASNINVNVGGDGAEVTAVVDNMIFRTFGTLCGGYIQCLHYRYRSSLK
jgi:hypothetical protein